MRVLVVSDVSPVVIQGGAERVLWEHASRLAARGHEVRIVARAAERGDTGPTAAAGVAMRHFTADRGAPHAFLRTGFRNAREAVADEVRAHGADVLHLHQPLSALAALGSGVARRIPSLYTFHSPAPLEYRLRRGTSALHRGGLAGHAGAALLWVVERAVLSRVTRVQVLSEFSADLLWRLYRVGGARVVRVPGGVDLARFRPAAERGTVREALGLPPGRPVLLTVRNLEPRMGLDTLIRALDLLRRDAPDVLLLVGGTGSHRAQLESLVAALDLRDHVRFAGWVPEPDLPRYYQAADAFVLPTRALEGFGLVTVEALACGTPVLGTRVGATPEILVPLDPRLLFEAVSPEAMARGLGRFLAEIARDPAAAARRRDTCRRHVETRFGWERVVDDLEAVLGTLAAGAAPPGALARPCPACGRPALRPGLRYRGARYRVCARCGTAAAPVLPSARERRRVYEDEYPARFAPECAPAERLALFGTVLADLGAPRGRLLDVGCGGGHLVAAAAARGWRASGADLSHPACAVARKASGAPVVQAESDALPFRDDAIDALTLVNVLDHAADPGGVLAEARRVLGPDGTLAIRVPNGAFHRASARLLRLLGSRSQLARYPILHLYAFTTRGLCRLVERSGFEVLGVRNSMLVGDAVTGSWTRGVLRALVRGGARVAAGLSGGRWLVGPSIELTARRARQQGAR